MSVFRKILPILMFFQIPCMAQVSLLPSVSHGETEKTSLKPAQREKKWGYIDVAGTFVIAPQFDSADLFSEGVAAVEVNERFRLYRCGRTFCYPTKILQGWTVQGGLGVGRDSETAHSARNW
jgi:hypothetical protein